MKLKVMLMGVLLLSSNTLLAQAIKDGRYALINRNSNFALDVKDVSKTNGALLQQWGYAGGSNQQFDVSHQGNGYYSVKAVHSGKVLDVAGVSLDMGAPIQQYTWANQANQLWYIASIDTGYYTLTAKHSGQAMEVWQQSKVNGGEIRQYRLTNGLNQQWKFQAVSSSSSSSSQASTANDCNSITNQPILRVAGDGSGQYKTVQAALNTLSNSNTTPTQIRIKPGTYREKLIITKPFVTFCGETGKATSTILTYNDGASTLKADGTTIGTSGSASVTLRANDVSMENITIENSFGVGSQAVALLAQGQRLQFRNCRLLGNQDTLYAHSGTQYYRNCHIQGTVDFIFGGATAVFDNNTIHSVGGGSALTAPSTEQTQPFGLVFLGGKVTAASSVAKGSVALGRNWRPYGAAAYIRTELGQHISAVGWVKMSENTLDTARFSEYLSTGAGANTSARAPQSKQLTAAQAATYTISNIFGAWAPGYSK